MVLLPLRPAAHVSLVKGLHAMMWARATAANAAAGSPNLAKGCESSSCPWRHCHRTVFPNSSTVACERKIAYAYYVVQRGKSLEKAVRVAL
jgi:hypothetical protein